MTCSEVQGSEGNCRGFAEGSNSARWCFLRWISLLIRRRFSSRELSDDCDGRSSSCEGFVCEFSFPKRRGRNPRIYCPLALLRRAAESSDPRGIQSFTALSFSLSLSLSLSLSHARSLNRHFQSQGAKSCLSQPRTESLRPRNRLLSLAHQHPHL